MTNITAAIGALTDQQAIRVLALTLDHDAPLPDPAALRDLDTGLRQALTTGTGLAGYAEPAPGQADPGDLARATLLYMAGAQPALPPVVIGVLSDQTGIGALKPFSSFCGRSTFEPRCFT